MTRNCKVYIIRDNKIVDRFATHVRWSNVMGSSEGELYEANKVREEILLWRGFQPHLHQWDWEKESLMVYVK